MTKPGPLSVFDLDAGGPERRVVTLLYRGVRIAISKERLHELLANEEALFNGLSAAPAGAPPPAQPAQGLEAPPQAAASFERVNAGPEPLIEPRQIPANSISHASLSTRIKKIYGYYIDKPKVLRPAHAGLLMEVINKFDGVVPEHATTRLELQLDAILRWEGVNEELRARITSFLADYANRKFSTLQVAR